MKIDPDLSTQELGDVADIILSSLIDGVIISNTSIHRSNDLINKNGLIDVARMRPVGRLGYNDYTEVSGDTCFTMIRPL